MWFLSFERLLDSDRINNATLEINYNEIVMDTPPPDTGNIHRKQTNKPLTNSSVPG